MWEGPSHSIWGTTPRTSAKGRVGVSMERQCIGFGVILCLDSLDWRMKIVGHEKFVSANFCCLYFTTVRPESPRLMWPRYSSEFMSTFWPWLKKDFLTVTVNFDRWSWFWARPRSPWSRKTNIYTQRSFRTQTYLSICSPSISHTIFFLFNFCPLLPLDNKNLETFHFVSYPRNPSLPFDKELSFAGITSQFIHNFPSFDMEGPCYCTTQRLIFFPIHKQSFERSIQKC